MEPTKAVTTKAEALVLDPLLSRIDIFPIKSLDAFSVQAAEFGPNGGLKLDRE